MQSFLKIAMLTFSVFLFLKSSSQDIEKLKSEFWLAQEKGDNEIVVNKGELILKYFSENKIKLDSVDLLIGAYTARSWDNLGRVDKSISAYETTFNAVIMNRDIQVEYKYNLLSAISLQYMKVENYNKALESAESALSVYNLGGGVYQIDQANLYYKLASIYFVLGRNLDYLNFNKKAFQIYRKANGLYSIECANALNNIGVAYNRLDRNHEALKIQKKVLRIRKKVYGDTHPGVAMSLNAIGSSYFGLGDSNKSISYHLKALDIIRKTLGEESYEYALLLNNLGRNYWSKGNYEEAVSMYENSVIVYNKIGRAYSPEFASVLLNLAECYSVLGYMEKCLELDLEACRLIESKLGVESSAFARANSQLAYTHMQLGNIDESFDLLLLSYEILKKDSLNDPWELGNCLSYLGRNCKRQGKYKEAIKYNQLALDVILKIYGDSHHDIGLIKSDLADCFFYLGDYKNSLQEAQDALAILKVKGNDKELSELYEGISDVYLAQGDLDKAKFYLNKSIVISKQLRGLSYANCLTRLQMILLKEGRITDASDVYMKAYRIYESNYYTYFKFLTAELALSDKKQVQIAYNLLSSLLSRDSSLSNFASRSWLNLNGIVGSEAANLESQIESSGDTALVHLMKDLKLNKKQLAKYRELTKEEKTSRGIDEKALEDEVSKQERELSKQSKAFADFNRRFNLKDVSSALKDDEVFVDIARVPYFSTYTNQWTDSVKYLVFIHDAKDSLVDYRFIDNGKELEGDVFADYKIDCSNQANATDLKNALYYNAFWKPIADKIGSSKTVYVSLGGVYNNINLNTLYNPETGKYLVEEKDIRIVNNARDFILSKEQTKRTYTSTSTALYGFPDYNEIETTTKDTADYLALTRDLDPLWIDSLTRGGLKASPLPATKVEIEQIAKSFKQNGWQVSEYLGDKASETNIKQEASPRVLHIATHGYFFDDIPTDKSNNERFLGMDRQRVVQDPMLRSGLLFTGANKTLHGEKVEGENGLLSASEASLLNLRGTELVVLSACETGKGEVKNSEGVYGLRKAFSDAGAAHTIMSLWKVDDKVTQEFMTRFYEIWLNEKTSIREAFNRTQLEIKAKYPQPYYWGAFVLVGK